MCWRTYTIVDLRHVCYMRLVGFVQIDSIPAAGKLDLGPKAIGTISGGHVGGFRARFGVVDAGEADPVGYRP